MFLESDRSPAQFLSQSISWPGSGSGSGSGSGPGPASKIKILKGCPNFKWPFI